MTETTEWQQNLQHQEQIIASLNDKVAVLTNALKTITEEKATMLTRFQADKKAVIDAHRTQIASIREEVWSGRLSGA